MFRGKYSVDAGLEHQCTSTHMRVVLWRTPSCSNGIVALPTNGFALSYLIWLALYHL